MNIFKVFKRGLTATLHVFHWKTVEDMRLAQSNWLQRFYYKQKSYKGWLAGYIVISNNNWVLVIALLVLFLKLKC